MEHFSRNLRILVFMVAALAFSTRASATIETPSPEISLSLRGVGDGVIEQGEPLRIAVRIDPPSESDGLINLAPASGTWVDAISVELARAADPTAVIMRGEPIGKARESHVTLAAGEAAGGQWRFGVEATKRLAPGAYVITARLVIPTGSAWKGEVISDEVPLSVVVASKDSIRSAQHALALARESVQDNKLEEAARTLDFNLAQDPSNPRVLTLRAAIAEKVGNHSAALALLGLASTSLPAGNVPPPVELVDVQRRVLASLFTEGDTNGEAYVLAPAWSNVPASVETALADKTQAERLRAPVDNSGAAQSSTAALPSPERAPGQSLPPSESSAGTGKTLPTDEAKPIQNVGVVVPASATTDAKVSSDSNGQWAASATAGSQYGKTQYSAAKAVGAPDVPVVGNSPDAWCPAAQNTGTDWLEVSFAKPVHATEVRVRQNDKPGAIAKVEAIEPDGTVHVWWEGVDPYVAPASRDIAWFAVRVPKTSYLVAKVKITLNLATVPGWKQIDAVQLVGVVSSN